tara:strand:+ start:2092 stop:2409 length:318 start_codon:yes stop_codon:yes gene_type:complete
MPYTKEQLENNEYYQNLKLEAEREYEENRTALLAEFQFSSSMDDGMNSKIPRLAGPRSPIQSFENPATGRAPDDPTNWITIKRDTPEFKRGDGLNEVLNREFTDL